MPAGVVVVVKALQSETNFSCVIIQASPYGIVRGCLYIGCYAVGNAGISLVGMGA